MTTELETIREQDVITYSRYYPCICLLELTGYAMSRSKFEPSTSRTQVKSIRDTPLRSVKRQHPCSCSVYSVIKYANYMCRISVCPRNTAQLGPWPAFRIWGLPSAHVRATEGTASTNVVVLNEIKSLNHVICKQWPRPLLDACIFDVPKSCVLFQGNGNYGYFTDRSYDIGIVH
jgi:hypothetical protein